MIPPPFRGTGLIEFPSSPDGEIGRHTRLKILRLNGRAGSIPAPGTINYRGFRKVPVALTIYRFEM